MIRIWEPATGEPTATLLTPTIGDSHDIEIASDAEWLVTFGNCDLRIWSTRTWSLDSSLLSRFPCGYGTKPVMDAAFSAEGTVLACTVSDEPSGS